MRRVAILLTLAAGLPLVACAAPAEVVANRCAGAGQPGSAAYAACLGAGQGHRLQSEQARLDEKTELDSRLGVGGGAGHP
jgi:hypothetical protein